MTYEQTVQWMFAQLPMYQNVGASAYKKDLGRILLLARHLGNPETKFKSIHVAGTNGKGSTSHMLASVLQEADYTVGLYTSPHLKDFRERIKINGQSVGKAFVTDFIKKNKSFLEVQQLSFFEMTVGMAFDYFAQKKVDIAVVEVGMGGRLDSTNIIKPLVSVITNIGLDHTQFLGDTLAQIAMEKAGIIKEKTPVVVGETQKETESVFRNMAIEKGASIVFADQQVKEHFISDLKGDYQQKNIKTAVCALAQLSKRGFEISFENVTNGLKNVTKNTNLLGRWQILQEHPKIICDTAHNYEGLQLVIKQVSRQKFTRLHFVLGFVNDKDLDRLVPLFPKEAHYYFSKPNVPRGMAVLKVQSIFEKNGLKGQPHRSVKDALKDAKLQAHRDDLIFVGGSTFVVAEVV